MALIPVLLAGFGGFGLGFCCGWYSRVLWGRVKVARAYAAARKRYAEREARAENGEEEDDFEVIVD